MGGQLKVQNGKKKCIAGEDRVSVLSLKKGVMEMEDVSLSLKKKKKKGNKSCRGRENVSLKCRREKKT